jgi:hypothetical protein
MDPVELKVPVLGSYSSAEESGWSASPVDRPPATRTRPSARRVAVCPSRPTVIDPVGVNVPAAVVEADGACVGLGLGCVLGLIDPVRLDPPVGDNVATAPEHAITANATSRIDGVAMRA